MVGDDVDDEHRGKSNGEEENNDVDVNKIWQHNGHTFKEMLNTLQREGSRSCGWQGRAWRGREGQTQ